MSSTSLSKKCVGTNQKMTLKIHIFSGERGVHLHRVKSVVSAFDKIQDFGVHPTTKPKVTPRPARPVRPTGNAVPRPYRPQVICPDLGLGLTSCRTLTLTVWAVLPGTHNLLKESVNPKKSMYFAGKDIETAIKEFAKLVYIHKLVGQINENVKN